MRLIDADALKRQIESPYTEYSVMIQIRKAIKEFIDDAPHIDIVRCKECRWWLKNLTEDDEDEAYLHCPIEDGSADDFCSYGERKESE